MSDILLIHYSPKKTSKTKILVDHLKATYKGEMEELDLLKTTPDFFLKDNLNAYVKRNYAGKKITEKQEKTLTTMDAMTEQFLKAKTVIIAYPMHNFSVPAVVKAYFDSIMQKGKTWDIDEEQGHYGLMQGHRALIITSSGSRYSDEEDMHDYSVKLVRTMFGFMDFDEINVVKAQGLDEGEREIEQSMKSAKKEIEKIARKWL